MEDEKKEMNKIIERIGKLTYVLYDVQKDLRKINRQLISISSRQRGG